MRAVAPRLLRYARAARAYLLVTVLLGLAVAGLIVVAVETGLRLLYGHMPHQAALLVLLLTPEAYLPLRAAAAQYHASAEGGAAAESIFAILGTPAPRQATQAAPRASVPDLHAATISLNGVTVTYPERDVPALAQLGLSIRPGELIMLTGPSGAGKTSLLWLLLKFIEPSAGTIRADGTDLATIPAQSWRAQLAWVPQQPRLFPGSVADNIALGQPAAPRAAIEDAARLAGAATFIEALPHGYDTRLGERAGRLSAGQRQQLALARGVLRDAPLLILDEPTAHLDRDARQALTADLLQATEGHTALFITHEPDGLDQVDRIIVLDHGRAAEQGTHHELRHAGGRYQRMCESQPR